MRHAVAYSASWAKRAGVVASSSKSANASSSPSASCCGFSASFSPLSAEASSPRADAAPRRYADAPAPASCISRGAARAYCDVSAAAGRVRRRRAAGLAPKRAARGAESAFGGRTRVNSHTAAFARCGAGDLAFPRGDSGAAGRVCGLWAAVFTRCAACPAACVAPWAAVWSRPQHRRALAARRAQHPAGPPPKTLLPPPSWRAWAVSPGAAAAAARVRAYPVLRRCRCRCAMSPGTATRRRPARPRASAAAPRARPAATADAGSRSTRSCGRNSTAPTSDAAAEGDRAACRAQGTQGAVGPAAAAERCAAARARGSKRAGAPVLVVVIAQQRLPMRAHRGTPACARRPADTLRTRNTAVERLEGGRKCLLLTCHLYRTRRARPARPGLS